LNNKRRDGEEESKRRDNEEESKSTSNRFCICKKINLLILDNCCIEKNEKNGEERDGREN
jgi:hypothetical protein